MRTVILIIISVLLLCAVGVYIWALRDMGKYEAFDTFFLCHPIKVFKNWVKKIKYRRSINQVIREYVVNDVENTHALFIILHPEESKHGPTS